MFIIYDIYICKIGISVYLSAYLYKQQLHNILYMVLFTNTLCLAVKGDCADRHVHLVVSYEGLQKSCVGVAEEQVPAVAA